MSDLSTITVWQGEPYTNTKIIADKLGARHKDLLRTFENTFLKGAGQHPLQKIRKVVLKNKQGVSFDAYELNEPAFTKLIMQLGRYEMADKIQDEFVSAFFLMREALQRQSNVEWLKTRERGKQARLDCTDVIKEFIEYAKKQGASGGVKFYYANLTKAEYKALGLVQHTKPKTRDLLSQMELDAIIMAEHMLKRLIKDEMENGEHYKVIYHKCKEALETYASSILVFKPKKQLQ